MPSLQPLPRSFYARDAVSVAKDLLGKLLVRRAQGIDRIGRIVETEAYLGPHDRACHSARGKTKRSATMFGPPGHAYVYLIYGVHHCFNIVTGRGEGAAVLIRALEPVAHCDGKTHGPGLLCKAMDISRKHDSVDLSGEEIFICPPDKRSCARTTAVATFPIISRPRIGIAYAGVWARRLLRFYLKGNAFISKP